MSKQKIVEEFDKEKARNEQYLAFLADIVEKHKRPRPDGSIDWIKAFGELIELKKQIYRPLYTRGTREDQKNCRGIWVCSLR